MSQQHSKNRVSFRRTVDPLATIDELIAEPKNYAKISFLLPPEALPASLLLATQRSRARLSGMRHLWDGLRVRLDNHAAGTQANNTVIQPTRYFPAIEYLECPVQARLWAGIFADLKLNGGKNVFSPTRAVQCEISTVPRFVTDEGPFALPIQFGPTFIVGLPPRMRLPQPLPFSKVRLGQPFIVCTTTNEATHTLRFSKGGVSRLFGVCDTNHFLRRREWAVTRDQDHSLENTRKTTLRKLRRVGSLN